MVKGTVKEGLIIELPAEAKKRFPLKEGDLLRVRLLNGKELVLERPKRGRADEILSLQHRIQSDAAMKTKKKLTLKDIDYLVHRIRNA